MGGKASLELTLCEHPPTPVPIRRFNMFAAVALLCGAVAATATTNADLPSVQAALSRNFSPSYQKTSDFGFVSGAYLELPEEKLLR